MPIRKEFRQYYGAEWRKVIRPRILARAGNKCEQCGVPNGALVERSDRWVTIVLTIAHLDRTPGHNDDANLAALCQFHHLNYDRPVNKKQAKETRSARKDASRPLLREAV